MLRETLGTCQGKVTGQRLLPAAVALIKAKGMHPG